jgi:hypothetical protein
MCALGGEMSKEEIAGAQRAQTNPPCDYQKQADQLEDLWDEWVKLVLELELEAVVRRQFPLHSK